MNRTVSGQLYDDLHNGSVQAWQIAQIIQVIRPDILLLNEFDYDDRNKSVQCFMQDYLAVPQHDNQPIVYPYSYTNTVNTGMPSGLDLDNDDQTNGPGDAFGYGQFPGQYGMILLSKYPIHKKDIRTFQYFLWKDMPNALLPDDPATKVKHDWYTSEELQDVRLSSKSHWDIPIQIGDQALHILAAHPTPPVFDGPEDRNGRRNHDEIRFWADYISTETEDYIYDDTGMKGGLSKEALFVILGDMNADPCDGDSCRNAVNQLLESPRIQDCRPSSRGAEQASMLQQGANGSHRCPPSMDTYQSMPGQSPGNLRLDYILPSCKIKVCNGAVFWPPIEDELSQLIDCSDHRMVYMDIQLNGSD